MANAVARLMLQIVGDSSSAVSHLKKTQSAAGEAEGAAKKTGSAWSGMRGVLAGIGAAAAATAVVAFAKQSVSAASDLNESWSKVGVVFGSAAGDVQAWSKTAATSMGLSQQAALEAVGTYGNLAVALGLPPKQAATMSKSLVGLAADLASFNNVPVGDALDALKSGLVGEAEPLRRFGVSISQTRVEAEALRLGLAKAPVDMAKVGVATQRLELAQKTAAQTVKKYGANSDQAKRAMLAVQTSQEGVNKAMGGGKVTMSDAAKAQATYSLIMKDTATAQGDFARTSDGLANQQRIASAQFKDMQATVGQALLPVLTTLGSFLTSTIIPVLQLVAKFIKDNSTVVQILAGAVLAIVVVFKIWTAVQWALNSALLANPVFWIVAGIVALVAVVVLIATKTRWFQNIWAAMCAGMTAAWRAVSGAIITAWNAVWSFIGNVFGWIKNAAGAVVGWIRSNWILLVGILTGPFGLAVAIVIRYWSQITGFFSGIISGIAGVFGRVVGAITQPFITAFNIVRGIVEGAIGAIRGAVSSVLSFVNSGIQGAKNVYNAFARVWNGIQVGFPGIDKGPIHIGGFTVGLPDLPLLAKGAYLTAPTLAVVGERGPEYVLPEARLAALLAASGGGTGRVGPAVVVDKAYFSERVDVDVFMRRVAWSLQTQRI